jgi:hypothetical protein
MRAGISVSLRGDGHLTSIGARFEPENVRICPEKLPQNCCGPVTTLSDALLSGRRP